MMFILGGDPLVARLINPPKIWGFWGVFQSHDQIIRPICLIIRLTWRKKQQIRQIKGVEFSSAVACSRRVITGTQYGLRFVKSSQLTSTSQILRNAIDHHFYWWIFIKADIIPVISADSLLLSSYTSVSYIRMPESVFYANRDGLIRRNRLVWLHQSVSFPLSGPLLSLLNSREGLNPITWNACDGRWLKKRGGGGKAWCWCDV